MLTFKFREVRSLKVDNRLLNELIQNINTEPKKTLSKAYEIYENYTIENNQHLSSLLYVLAGANWLLGNSNDASNYCQKILSKSKSKLFISRAYKILGNIATDSKDFLTGFDYFSEALEVAPEEEMAPLYNNIATILIEINDYEKGLEYFNKALEFAENNAKLIININMVETHIFLKNFTQAKKHLKISSALLEEIDNIYFKGALSLNYGLYYFNTQDYDKALHYNKEALEIYDSMEAQFRKIEPLIQRAEIYGALSNFKKKISILEEAETLANKYNAKNFNKEIFSLLAQAYKENGQKEKSFTYYQRYHDFINTEKDSLMKRKRESLQTKVKINDIVKKNLMIKSKNTELKATNKKMQLMANIGQNITSTLDPKVLTKRLYKSLSKLMPINYFGTGLYNKKIIDFSFYRVKEDQLVNYIKPLEEKTLTSWCLKNDSIIYTKNYHKEFKKYKETLEIIDTTPKSIIYIPIHFRQKIIGFFTVQSLVENAYSEEDVELLKTLTPFIGIALRNSYKSKKLVSEIQYNKRMRTKLKETNKKLQNLSKYDALTNIPNRRYLLEYFENQINLSIRQQTPLSILIVDIDHFKSYNDNYGHIKGDKCIQKISQLINDALKRKSDFIGRYGGDEFVVILPDTDEYGSQQVAKDIQKKIITTEIPHNFSLISEYITVSIGGYTKSPKLKETSPELLIHRADKALYNAKKRGRNTYINLA